MAVVIRIEGDVFDRGTLDQCLKSLVKRDFVDNDGHRLIYGAGSRQVIMSGEIAAAPGEQPRGCNDFPRRQDYQIIGSGQADIIRASRHGSSVVEGHAGDDRLVSRGTNDKLFGGASNDTLVARGGDTTLRGDAGADTFVIRHADTDACIMDFEPGRDHVAFGTVLDKLLRGNLTVEDRMKFIGDDDFGGGGHQIRADLRHSGDDTFTVIGVSLHGREYQLAEFRGAIDLDRRDFIF